MGDMVKPCSCNQLFWLALAIGGITIAAPAFIQPAFAQSVFDKSASAQLQDHQIAQGTDSGGAVDPESLRDEIPRGETVTSRARPELDPLGIRAGSFLLFPKLDVQESFNDNVFATESDKKSDFITRIIPSILVDSDWNRHALSFQADTAIGLYLDNSDENYEDYRVGTAGRLDITGESYLSAGVDYKALHEGRGSPDDAGGTEPSEYDVVSGNVEFFQDLGRFNLTVDGTVESFNFDDASAIVGGVPIDINNDDRDRYETEGTVRFGYEIIPDYEAFVRGAYNFRRYGADVDDAGFNRDSEGYEVVAGVAIDFGGLVFGDFFVGYAAQNFDDSALKTIDGATVGADMTWNVTPLTTVVGTITRTVEETTVAGASGSFSTALGLSVDHELLRNLLLGADAGVVRRDYEGFNRTDDTFNVGVDAKYMLNRHLYLSSAYGYRTRTSDAAGVDYDENLFLLRLEAQY